MFDNIIAQEAAVQIALDIERRTFPPSVLFQGPPLSGKGTAALEAARVFSCETSGAPWSCRCGCCLHHRLLAHSDVLAIGPRPFIPEINAAKDAFFREALPATKALFVRSVKKLLLRFSPVLMEDDARLSKVNAVLETLNEDLDEWSQSALNPKKEAAFSKLTDAIVKNAVKLEADGITGTIPVSHIRAASYWLHTAPQGNKKVFIIENAENMLDAARNSLLKTLEEPPKDAVIILTSAHPKMLLATILSRTRPYTFTRRGAADESEILRRVFREKAPPEKNGGPLLAGYFERFLTVPRRAVHAAAALWIASAASAAAAELQKAAKTPPPELIALGKYAAAIAKDVDCGGPALGLKALLAAVMEKTAAFAERETFARFLGEMSAVMGGALSSLEPVTPCALYYVETARTHITLTHAAVETYNQGKPLALERLFAALAAGFSKTL